MAQLTRYKTDNEIISDFRNLIIEALNAFDIPKWEVRQLNQVFKTNVLKPTVFIYLGNDTQRGREYVKNVKIEEQLYKQYSTKQEITIRFLAARRELASDTVNTKNPKDILRIFRGYMQSDLGVKFLANLGYAQYTPTEISNQNYTNDEDNFQLLPYFDCTFVYTDKWLTPIGEITKIEQVTHIL